jgi:pimeloyl-ACP methyl ester carboxylesterase
MRGNIPQPFGCGRQHSVHSLLAKHSRERYPQYDIVASDADMFKHKGKRPMRKILPLLLGCGFTILLAGSPRSAAQLSEPERQRGIEANPRLRSGSEVAQKAKGKYDPPGNLEPTADVLKEIQAKTAQLAAKVADLRKEEKHAELLPDVEIYLRGAENIVRFKEFYNKASGKWTLDALDRGLQRAEQLGKGDTPWTKLATRNVARGYRSVIDGTAQPYGVTYPLEYGKGPKRKWRVDVVLHGRNNSLTEVSFLNTHNGKKKVEPDQDWVQIDIYGRGNNAYRWAGEMDVFEAMNTFFAEERIHNSGDQPDHHRVVLRGFSMGGAGTWHLGLHLPGSWCVMGPGAGFTTTHDYAWKGKKELPDYQERCLRIYDAIDYVENARVIPIVAYSGGNDPQKVAADNIENRLKQLKIDRMTHLVAPGLGHTFPADWFKKANTLWAEHAAKGRDLYPKKVSFVTYTMKYPTCDWVWINGMEKHYEKAMVNAEWTGKGFRVTTKNVRGLHLTMYERAEKKVPVDIDGQEILAEPEEPFSGSGIVLFLARKDGKWRTTTFDAVAKEIFSKSQKLESLTGPIDDAFTRGFVCVLGSGDTFHPSTQKFVDAKIKAFKYDWGKHWRGELPTTGDYAVTPNDIKDKNLILFGDPSSNLTLAQILPKLPLKWTKDEIEFAGKKYKASEHVPVMIFPNPLNPSKYVVLNTGHTFPSADYVKTNALLYARLGDYAILRMTPSAKDAAAYEVATAGLFDEFWQVEKK